MCAAELRIPSFNAHRFQTGTQREREREATILIENEGQFGISGLTDDNQIIDPALMEETYRAIDIFFRKLPEEVRLGCVHPVDANLGYSWPGREEYGTGSDKDVWKQLLRFNIVRGYPRRLWPSDQKLKRHLKFEDELAMARFQNSGIYQIHAQLVNLGTIALNALAEFYYGLGPNYFSGTRNVGGKDYRLVQENTLQLIQYLNGTEPELQEYFEGRKAKVGDLIFGEHADSSAGTIGDMRKDPEHCLEGKVGNEWRPVVVEGGTYFFQFGKNYRLLIEALIAEGKIDPDKLKYGTLAETLHRGVRRSVESQRPGIVDFLHPQADMPLLNGMVTGDVLKRDLGEYMAKAPQ
ncbi:MAG: hypothetical protein Q7R76_01940 [Candidatus Woesearchaeota archaeon]|nr:hypothetical protein [Candidatus Woesearchaeota archaeon]